MKVLKPYSERKTLDYFDKNLFYSFFSKKGIDLAVKNPEEILKIPTRMMKTKI
jgi:hypothetical protein